MTRGYIKKEYAVEEIKRNHALNYLFFSRLIEKLQEDDFWKDAKFYLPKESNEYIVSVYSKSENRWYSFWTFYDAQFNEWSVECENDYEVFFWANFPEPKTKDNVGSNK